MKYILPVSLLALLLAAPIHAEPPRPPKIIRGPVVGKPVKPTKSLPLSEILQRQRAQQRASDEKASPQRKTLNDYLAKYPASRSAAVTRVESKALENVFPKTSFFALQFRKFPVAVAPPKPLASNNVYAVAGKTVTHLSNEKALGGHFRKNARNVNNADKARAVAVAYLQLSQQFHQDGFFKFQEPKVDVTPAKGGFIAVGEVKVVAQRGDRGSVKVSLSFLDAGLETVTPGGKVSPGIRPRCQATRLLDPDPAVRDIMRRDLVVMGAAARGYLAEQWEKADPLLRREIEDVWQQILAEGR